MGAGSAGSLAGDAQKPVSSGGGRRSKSALAAVAGWATVNVSNVPADGSRSAQSGCRDPLQNRASSWAHMSGLAVRALGVCKDRRGSRVGRRSGAARPPKREFCFARARSTASAASGVRGRRTPRVGPSREAAEGDTPSSGNFMGLRGRVADGGGADGRSSPSYRIGVTGRNAARNRLICRGSRAWSRKRRRGRAQSGT